MKQYEHNTKLSERNFQKINNSFGYSGNDTEGEGFDGYECSFGEVIPGYDRFIQLKAILEKKYGQHITWGQMRAIFMAVLSDSKHEKRVKKKYGEDSHGHWKTRYEDGKLKK